MPPTLEATTGRPFHIASETVSPKPSARLFWTTTSARRCSALTITAFSSASSIGSSARCTRRRIRCGYPCHAVSTSSKNLRPLRIVGHRRHVGAGEQEVGLLVGVDVLGERREHAQRVLEAIPARDLGHQRYVDSQSVLLDDARQLDVSDAAVEALEDRS